MKRVIKKHGRKMGTICKGNSDDKACHVTGCYGPPEYYCDYPGCGKPACANHVKLIKYNTHHCKTHLLGEK